MGSCAADSTLVEIWREHPPSSYSLKINKLSQLNNETFKSRRFLSGGYNWRLVIYPKGNEKDNGNGFVSMYVEFDNTSLKSTPPSEVFAYLTFFVYNKKATKYFTIQDLEVKRFNALRTVWGLPQVLSLGTFNDPENGYIFEGEQCEFGVDVMVASPFTKWEVVSFGDCFPKFSWEVKNFSKLKENRYVSNSFPMGGRKWVLKLYPKCYSTSDGKWISIFLKLEDNERLVAEERIYTRGHLRVLDPCGSNHVTKKFICWHDESNSGCGHDKIVSVAKVHETYLERDTLSIEVEFEVVSSSIYIRLWVSNSKPIGHEWIGPYILYTSQDLLSFPMWDIVIPNTPPRDNGSSSH